MQIFKRSTTYEEFWKWFIRHEEDFYELHENYSGLFNKLDRKLSKVNADLTFEFKTELVSKKRDFIISADGMKNSFKDVEGLVNCSPLDTQRWNLIAFRQRTGISEIEFKGHTLKAENLYFLYDVCLCGQTKKIDLDIFVEKIPFDADTISACYIFLDNLLGEYQVATKLRYIEFYPFEKSNISLSKIEKLPEIVDSL